MPELKKGSYNDPERVDPYKIKAVYWHTNPDTLPPGARPGQFRHYICTYRGVTTEGDTAQEATDSMDRVQRLNHRRSLHPHPVAGKHYCEKCVAKYGDDAALEHVVWPCLGYRRANGK